jgi:Leucine-rich repeat (LRR) protein
MFAVDLEEGSRTPSGEVVDAQGDHSEYDNGSQLPNVEEYKAQNSAIVKNDTRWGGLKWCLIILVPIILAAICAGIALFVIEQKDTQPAYTNGSSNGIPADGDGNSVDNPADAYPRTRVFDVAEFVIKEQWSTRASTQSPGTPQWEAIEWIADFDSVKLPIDDSLNFKQRYVLAVLYFALGGENWTYKLEFLDRENVCDWYQVWPAEDNPGSSVGVQVGVSCYDDLEVSEIFLPAIGLKGELPQEIGLLTGLTDLTLYGNEISGVLPNSMKRLTALKQIIMHDNKLDGPLPDIFTNMNLSLLNLANNNIAEELPDSLFDMTSLITLNLAKNNIDAEIGQFALLGNLQALFLEGNLIYGGLGEWIITQWPNLEVLDLSDNFLMSSVPAAIFWHPKLVIVDLHANRFFGPLTIPSMSQNSDLQFLSLQENQLNGAIPEDIGLMQNMNHLDLAKNLFTSAMPEAIFGLSNLKYLSLAYNNFEPGVIPASIENMVNLVDLSLKETNRQEEIPASIGSCANLVMLDLDGNALGGNIPSSIGNLNKLTFLFLNENKLIGQVPASFGNLQNLHTLLLNNNTLTGPTNVVCAPTLPTLSVFIADCKDPSLTGNNLLDEFFELDCPCCTKCCSDGVSGCNNEDWYGELDPIWEYKYARRAYSFNEDNIVFPTIETFPGEDATEYIVVPDLSGLYSTLPDEGTVPDAEFVADEDRIPSDTYQYGSP